MPIIGWIRDLFGIQKDMYETKKTRLEIEKIEDEKRLGRITLATTDDVKKYDPKAQTLDMMERVRREHEKVRMREEIKDRKRRVQGYREIDKGKGCVVVLALLLIALLYAVVW